jgi:ATP-binding cassette subfamily B protein
MRNPYFNLLRISWVFAGTKKLMIIKIYLCFVCGLLITLSLPLLYGWFINEIQAGKNTAIHAVWLYGSVYICLNILKWLFFGLPRVWEQKLAFHIGKNYFARVYDETLYKNLKWHQSEHSGSYINRLKKAQESLRTFFQTGFQYFYTVARFIFCSAAMLYFSPSFGAIGVLLGITAIILTKKFDEPLSLVLSEVNEREHRVSSAITDSLSNINTVKTLGLEEQMKKNILFKFDNIFPPFKRSIVLGEWKWFTTDMIVAFIYVILIIGYVYKNAAPGQVFYIGGLVTLIAYVTQFTGVFYEFAWQYNQVIKYNVDVCGINLPDPDLTERENSLSEKIQDFDWKVLHLKIKGYQYENKDAKFGGGFFLKACTMRIEKGQKIAVIGESGSGKTTFIRILGGLYISETAVEITANGSEIIAQKIFSNNVALIPQEPEIFENTIRYNLTMGVEYPESKILNACHIACFTEVLQTMPEGLETQITEKGFNLSGGQKQRLALARGILAAESKDIIILDEPTSNVDTVNESKIYERLFAYFSSKVIISTLHRLYLLPEFDYIYAFKDGSMILSGSYNELISDNLNTDVNNLFKNKTI